MRNSTASSGISQWHAMFYETRGYNFGHLHQHPNLANSMEVEGDAPGMWPMKKWMTRLTRWTSCRNRNDCTTFGIVSCFGNSLVHSRSAIRSETTWMLFDLIQPNGCGLAKTNISNIKNNSILQISTVEKEKNIPPKHSHLTPCSPKWLLFKNCHVLVGGFNHLEEY